MATACKVESLFLSLWWTKDGRLGHPMFLLGAMQDEMAPAGTAASPKGIREAEETRLGSQQWS